MGHYYVMKKNGHNDKELQGKSSIFLCVGKKEIPSTKKKQFSLFLYRKKDEWN